MNTPLGGTAPRAIRMLARLATLTIAALMVLLALWIGVLAYEAKDSGLAWGEMDFDHDGSTSVGELLVAADVGQRVVVSHGRRCTEWYSLKDGLPVTLRCPSL